MDWLWYVIPIVIAASTLFFKGRRQARLKNNLPIIAQSLGLQYFDRIDQLPDHIAAAKADLPSALSDPENVKGLQKYGRLMSGWRIEGEYSGVKVKITPRLIRSRKSQSRYTRLEAYFTQPTIPGLTISNMGNTPLGKPEIKVENLNKKIIVKTENESITRQLLRDSDVQSALNTAFEFSSEVVIDDAGTRVDKYGPAPLEVDYYRQGLDHLTRIVRAIENRSRFVTPR
jgi:hypothetical protein